MYNNTNHIEIPGIVAQDDWANPAQSETSTGWI